MSHQEVRDAVRESYRKVAAPQAPQPDASGACCSPGCCAPKGSAAADDTSRDLGYTDAQLAEVTDGANLGLGCGNPHAIAGLAAGETVLDLGCGGGFDCFLASKQVGPSGRVIGVDMTPEMLTRARTNAETMKATNVDFRLGEIEHLPVQDATVDVILSNCVVNLSPEKQAVFHEAFRVLAPGGRLAISDVVATEPLSEQTRHDLEVVSGCIGGAAEVDELKSMLSNAGFENIRVAVNEDSRTFIRDWFPGKPELAESVASATIEATKANA